MIKNKKIIVTFTACFLTIEALIGMFIHTSSGRTVNLNQFCSIIFACLFCVLFIEKSSGYIFTQIALIFTVFADYFLVWLSPQIKLYGMICFAVVQLSYAARLYFDTESKNGRKLQFVLRAVLSVAVILVTVAVLGDKTDALSLVSMFYYTNLVLNIVFSFASFKRNYIIAFAFVLFILCDTIIGFYVLKDYFPIQGDALIYDIIHPGFDLSWAFYLPSQMLLAISLLPYKFKKADSK